MAAVTTQRERTFPPILKYLLDQQVGFALILWPAFAVFTLVVILAVAYWNGIEVSGWDRAIEAINWFALFIGAYAGWSALPLAIAHGRTRHEFMRQVVMFVPLYAAALALMVTITFVAEAGLYHLAGWPQEVSSGKLYGSALELHLVFLQAWLLIGLWTAGGMFIATAWYRNDGLGGLAIAVAVVFAGISGITFSADWGPFGALYEWLTGDGRIHGGLGVVIHFACIAAVLGLTWLIVRDIPVRNKTA